jgi:PKD repeat protein
VLVEPSTQQSTTDGQGRAQMFVTAPAAPAFLPTSTSKLTITARPVGADALATLNARSVEVQLVPPEGTLPINRAPIAAFTMAPVVGTISQSISFDASLTTDEGEPCAALCTYAWDFGDYETANGKTASHSYPRPGTYTVTLTVVDNRGGVASTTRSLTITGPTAPVAAFAVSPASPKVNQAAVFNGGTSSVGIGATIETYKWEFGDGSSQTTTVPGVSHTYGAVGTYFALLTVTDNFGRTSIATATVTVVP